MRPPAAQSALPPLYRQALYRTWRRVGLSAIRPAGAVMTLILIGLGAGGCSLSRTDGPFAKMEGRDVTGSLRSPRTGGPAPTEADAYFATRPKQAQIGAWASKQSQPLESRFAFEQAIAKIAARHIVGEVPRPPGWSGWRIAPQQFEFWHDRPFRLHDRIEFRREAPDQPWSKTRLYP